MKKIAKWLFGAVALAASLPTTASTFVGDRSDFRDETIYFVMTTRFYDGDPSNNTQCWDNQERNAGDPAWRGDFAGLIEKLDYIKALGFTAVWITPVVENASGYDYHGYHASDISKVDHRYESGSVENPDVDFQDLIDAAHAKGMKIILDIVLNHTGNFGEGNLCKLFERDWSANQADIDACMKPITVKDGGKLPDNYLSLAPGLQYQARLAQMKNTDGKNHDVNNYWHHYGSFNWDDDTRWWAQIAGDCVDLNTENQAVADYLVDCYGQFIKMGVDGFRIDTSGHISRLTFNKMFIPQFNALAEQYKAKRNGGPFFMYGEVCSRDRNVTYRGQDRLSPYFYTWKETKTYAWDTSTTSWNNIVVPEGSKGTHTNVTSVNQHAADYLGTGSVTNSTNAFLNGNNYHTPDHSQYSGFSVIDFPMHWNFRSASEAWGVRSGDKLYNDATYNVVYVDSHDYAPDGAPESTRFAGDQSTWAENMALMFTFRGIPCIYYGSEIEFKKGKDIDKGPNIALRETGRAYFGGYIKGSINVTDFAQYSDANGNIAATLSHPLAQHVRRLNQIRAAVPALRKGQYSTEGCTGSFAFKRRYTDSTTDSYCLVTISGGATFTGVENGTYVDAVTGDTKTVTNGTLTASCSGKGNMRVYVLNTTKTPAPGKVGTDGKYLYTSSSTPGTQLSYDGTEEEDSSNNGGSTGSSTGGGGGSTEPEEPIEPSLEAGEHSVFFESAWSGTPMIWVWTDSKNYTGGNWPGKSMTYLGNKVWKWTADEAIPAGAKVIFSCNGTQTETLNYVNGGYYTSSGLVKTIQPSTTNVAVTVNPAGGNFYDSQEVTITAVNATTSWYRIGSGAQTSFSGSATFTIGATEAVGTTITVSWGASNATDSKTGSVEFTKIERPAQVDNIVYFDNSKTNWSVVYCYAWNDGGNNGKWPGVKMEQGENNLWRYDLGSNNYSQVIFSNGNGTQTVDLTCTAGNVYKVNGEQNGKKTCSSEPYTGSWGGNQGGDQGGDQPQPTGSFNVYWDNSNANWATPYVHYFGGSSESSWPGVAMTKVEGNIWSYTVPAGTTGLVFNAGDGDNTKTGDMTAQANHVYKQDGDKGEYTGGNQGGDQPQPTGSFNVYWDNSDANWNVPYIHYWGATESAWPGVAMTRYDGDVWVYTVPAGTTGCLFHPDDNQNHKTADLEAKKNHIYNFSGDQGEYITAIIGDVNGDNLVNVSDVTAVVNAIINGGDDNADVNGDKVVNVSDITFIVNLLLTAE